MGMTSSSTRAIATTLAPGQFLAVKNSRHSSLPIISVSAGPEQLGMTNSPTTGMNTSIEPATMPGIDSGSVIFMNALNGRPQVRRGLEQRKVHLLQIRVQRQDHEGRYE